MARSITYVLSKPDKFIRIDNPNPLDDAECYTVWTPIFAHETPGSVWGQIGVEIWPPPPPYAVLFSKFANLLVIDEKASFLLVSRKIFIQTGY